MKTLSVLLLPLLFGSPLSPYPPARAEQTPPQPVSLPVSSLQILPETSLDEHEATGGEIAIFTRVLGTVEFSADASVWTAAGRGTNLDAGTSIRTSAGASAVIRFLDGSVVRVQEKSVVKISGVRESESAVGSRDVALKLGALGFEVKRRPDQRFTFSSPTAVASIKGTEGTFESAEETASLTILSSELPDDAADFTLLGTKETQSLKIGETAFIDQGKLVRRPMTERERTKVSGLVDRMRSEHRKGFEAIQKRRSEVKQAPQAKPDAKPDGKSDVKKKLMRLNLRQIRQQRQLSRK